MTEKPFQNQFNILFKNSIIIALLWAGGWLGTQTSILPEWQSLLWPPTGMALAIVLYSGYKNLPGIMIGIFAFHFTQSQMMLPAFIAAVGSGTAAAVGTFLLHAFGFKQNLSRLSDAFRLIFLGGFVSTLINATFDTTYIIFQIEADQSLNGVFWLHTWLSHVLGILLFTPLMLTWRNHPPTRFAIKKVAESIAILTALITITVVIYTAGVIRIAYLPFPFLIWAAFRLERRGTLFIGMLIILLANLLLIFEVGGPLGDSSANSSYSLWLFMCAVAITAVTVSVANHERQQSKRQFQEERDFAQQVMEQLGQGVTISGPHRRFEYVNKAFSQMLGYETHELLQLSPFKIAVPGDAHLLEESYTAKQDRETTTYEVRLQHRNGRFIHAFVTSVPRIQNNQVIGSISVITDLTERNKAEQKLLHSEQKHKQLFVSAQRQTQELALLARLNASLARELDLSIIYVTVVDALADTFGYDLVSLYTRQGDKLILQHQRGFTNVHPSLSINFGVIGRVIRTGESAFVTDTQLDNDYISLLQDDVNHSELCVPLFYESNIVGAINIESAHVNAFSEEDLHLLTMLSEHVSIAIERAYLHNKVIYNEKRFRALVEHNPATITLVDKLGNFQPINTITPSFHNQNQKNLFDPDSIHPNDIEKVKTTFQSLLKSPGSSQNIIYRILTENGGIQWVEKTFTNLLNEPAVQAVVINSRDITERKQAEEALQQAQKLESLGILAGGIAHDFNNLLVAMMGQISLAQLKGKKDSMAQPHLQKAYTATERASALTRQLLAYSGKGQFQIESIDLNQLITDNLHLFSVGLPKTIQLSSDLHEPLPPVRVDIGQMQQVIMNLIINGKEAIGNESGIVNITTGVSHITPSISQSWPAFGIAPPAGDYVMLTVTDNGTGMDEETLSKIFDPFFTTKFTGRGLGLAAVQGIVRGHNGGLTVHSTPNHGSRFDLLFPIDTASMMPTNEKIIKEKSAAYMAEPIPIRQSNDDKMALVKGMILVVDDEAPVRDTLNDILSSESLEVLTAVNSQDGIQQLQQQQNRIKLIILDLSMPGLSIKEAITQFRQITPNIPLMISSGYSESEANQQLGDLDVAGFLQKPYNVKKLITIVNKQLAENREKTDENTFIYKQEIS